MSLTHALGYIWAPGTDGEALTVDVHLRRVDLAVGQACRIGGAGMYIAPEPVAAMDQIVPVILMKFEGDNIVYFGELAQIGFHRRTGITTLRGKERNHRGLLGGLAGERAGGALGK